MTTAREDHLPKARSALLRWVLSSAILATLGIVGAMGLAWAREPGERNATTIAFELPLKPGTRIEQEFTAQTDWMFEIRIRIEHPRAAAPEAADGDGRWKDEARPTGLRIAYTLHAGKTAVSDGGTEDFSTASNGLERVTGGRIEVEHGKQIPYRIGLEVSSAPPEFEDLTAAIEVGPVGDFISYRSLEAKLRNMVFFVGFGLGLALAFAWLIMLWRPRRNAA